VVLVHGLATTRSIWRLVAPALAERRRVVALDVPGFGRSPPLAPGFDLEDVADAIAEGLAAVGLPARYDVVGHSMGGALALALAHRRPDAVATVVLVSPAGLFTIPRVAAQAAGATAAGLIALRRAAAPIAVHAWGRRLLMVGGALDGARFAPEEVRTMVRASSGATRTRQALAAAAATDMRDVAVHLLQPLAVIRGERDPVVPAGVVRALAARRPDLACATIADAGHLPMMERPEAFVDVLEDLLDAPRR
jgi:pimeloyl-ACP methyl ester carboxylesterase